MFGVFFALLCTVALFRLWRRPGVGSLAYARNGCGGGWHRSHDRSAGDDRSWSRQVMRDVAATPSQERAIQDATDGLADASRRRQHAWGLAEAVADTLTEDTFDRQALAARLVRDDDSGLRDTVVSTVERLHASLDPTQRRTVAKRLRGSSAFTN